MKRPVETAQLRLIAKVARMYHEGGVRQPQIAAELSLSQARVSRLLRQASEIGVVRTVVTLPPGVYTDLEESNCRRSSASGTPSWSTSTAPGAR